MCLGRRRDLIASRIALYIAVFPRPLLQPDLRPPPEHSERRSKAEPVPLLISLPIRQCTLLVFKIRSCCQICMPPGSKTSAGAARSTGQVQSQQTAAAWIEDLGQRAPWNSTHTHVAASWPR